MGEAADSNNTLAFQMCPDCAGRMEYYKHGTVYCPACDEQFQHIYDEVDGDDRHRLTHRERGRLQEVRV